MLKLFTILSFSFSFILSGCLVDFQSKPTPVQPSSSTLNVDIDKSHNYSDLKSLVESNNFIQVQSPTLYHQIRIYFVSQGSEWIEIQDYLELAEMSYYTRTANILNSSQDYLAQQRLEYDDVYSHVASANYTIRLNDQMYAGITTDGTDGGALGFFVSDNQLVRYVQYEHKISGEIDEPKSKEGGLFFKYPMTLTENITITAPLNIEQMLQIKNQISTN